VVAALHGNNMVIGKTVSPWGNILRSVVDLKAKGVDLERLCNKVVGNGEHTRFWQDRWIGYSTLKEQFPRVCVLDPDQEATVRDRNTPVKMLAAFGRCPRVGVPTAQWESLCLLLQNRMFSDAMDRYVWDLEPNGEFSVASTRAYIDVNVLEGSAIDTRWNKLVPRKINTLIWRIERDRIPTRFNLSAKGVEIHNILCPICGLMVENSEHLFARCEELSPIWSKIARWWNVNLPSNLSIAALLKWPDEIKCSKDVKVRFDGVVLVTFWMILKFRNAWIFGKVQPRKNELFDDNRQFSYFWILYRSRKKIVWDGWLSNPSLM